MKNQVLMVQEHIHVSGTGIENLCLHFICVLFPIHYFISSSFETLYSNLWDKELKLFSLQVVPEVQMIKTLCLINPTVLPSSYLPRPWTEAVFYLPQVEI